MKLPKILTETPNMEHPTMGFSPREHPLMGLPTTEHPTTNNPLFDLPPAYLVDSDRDGVIDPWDCQPFNPDEDGLIGDMVKKVVSYAKPNFPRAAERRAAVGRAISGGIGRGVNTMRQIGGFVRPNYPRAARRRAAVRTRVGRAIKSFRIDTSPEAAAGRRAKIKSGMMQVGRRIAKDETGAIAASARTLGGIAGMGAETRRQVVQGTALPTAQRQVAAFTAPEVAFGIPAYIASVGRQQMITPQAPPTQSTARSVARSVSHSGGQRYTGAARPQRRRRASNLPEPDLDASEW